MKEINAQQLLHERFSSETRGIIVPTVKRAYIAVEETIEAWPYLSRSRKGFEMRRHLRNVAVEYELMQLSKNGDIPFSYKEVHNAARNCHHLELADECCILTISQVATINEVPREAVFRNNHSLSNLITLFGQDEVAPKPSGKHYVVLTHGYRSKTPDFIALGAPEPYVVAWAAQAILQSGMTVIPISTVEKIPERPTAKLKNHLIERLIINEKPGAE